MSEAAPDLVIARHGAEGMHRNKDKLLAAYCDVYAAELSDPFSHPDRFWARLEAYARRDGFCLVTGCVDGELAGYALGAALPENTRWWAGYIGEPADPDLLRETGTRTFAINELMVRSRWRRRGYAKALIDALLARRTEERATLLVRGDNVPAYTAYRSWGFERIGQVKPFDDSPTFEAMVLALGARRLGARR